MASWWYNHRWRVVILFALACTQVVQQELGWRGRVRKQSSVGTATKSMFSIMFKTTGALHVQCAKSGETITGDYYIRYCLSPTVREINEQRPISGTTNMKILHDNARPHVTQGVRTYLDRKGIVIIDHPPYSPDLAPSDFWLFDTIKRQLTSVVENIPKNKYLKTFKKWLERLDLCIKNDAYYFEHLIKENKD